MGLTKPRAAQIYNLDYKQATRVVTVVNITLSAGAPSTVDGVNLSLNDRVLVTAQTTGSQNGLYKVTTVGAGSNGTWARTSDGNDTGEIEAGMLVMVTEGTIYADTQWKLTTNDPIVIGTTSLSFTQNYSANSISSGTSNVTVLTNANVTISSAGTANVLLISNTGIIVTGTESVTANITAGNVLTGGLVSATGNATVGNISATTYTGTTVSVSGNVTGNYILGNGSQLTGISGGGGGTSISSGTSNVNVVSSGGNVTVGVGGIGNVLVAATTGAYVTGVLSATGNITGSNISATNHTGTTVSVTGTTTAASVVGGVITGTSVSATGNVTGGNLLTGGLISVGGNVTASNITISGSANISTFIGNVFFGSVPAQPTWYTIAPLNLNNSLAAATKVQLNLINTGGGANAGSAIDFYTYQISVLAANAEARIAAIDDGNYSAWISLQTKTPGSTGTNGLVERVKVDSTGASVVANITGGNLLTGGLISATGNATVGNISATTHTGTTVSVSGNVTGNYILGNGSLLTGLSGTSITNGTSNVVVAASGNVSIAVAGNNIISVTATGIINNLANGSGNIGNATGYFNTAFVKATSAQYADLAEMYAADQKYVSGTVVEFGGEAEVTQTTQSHSTAIAGIVSTNPSYLMNATQTGDNVVAVALIGRVPCRVVGTIQKGDRLVSSGIAGTATAYNPREYQPGCIIGKAMADYDSINDGVIEVAVGRD